MTITKEQIFHGILGVLVFIIAAAAQVNLVLAFSGSGSGTSGDPFQVDSCSRLQEVANNVTANYKQTANINCQSAPFTDIANTITPFTGVYDGQNFTISNLQLTTVTYVGLFQSIGGSAVLQNIRINTISGTSASYAGGLVGYTQGNPTITDSSVVNGNLTANGVVD